LSFCGKIGELGRNENKQDFPAHRMTDCNFLQKAISLVQQATAEDRNKDYENALEHYQLALQYFMTALQCKPSFLDFDVLTSFQHISF
jgi:hypothetical protein